MSLTNQVQDDPSQKKKVLSQLEEEILRNSRCVCEARDLAVKKIRLGKLGLLKDRYC